VDALGHSYTSKVTKEPGCTDEGVETFTCGTCGDSYTKPVAAIGHSYSAVVTKPTCTEKGYTTHECANCGDSYKDTYTDATGHNYVDGQCSNCGEGCVHNWGTGSVTTAPTCTTTGVRIYVCDLCEHTKTEPVAALGHTEVIDAAKAPTCTATGLTEGKHCAVCGEVTVAQTEVPTLDHSYVAGKCSACGDTKTVSLPGSFNDWNAEAAMTWTENGYVYTMELSAGTYKFKVLKNGVWLGNYGTIYDDTSAAENGWKFEDADDCTLVATGGTYTFIFNFDTDMLVVTNDHTHSHTAGEVTAPTCTEQGYTTYTCACGDSYKDDYVDALGHSYVAGKCSACGNQLSLYLVGWINGADYDGTDYLFVDGKLVVTFTAETYIVVKAGPYWYMSPTYVDGSSTSAIFYPATEECKEKMYVPVGAELTFTLTAGEGDSFVLRYEITDCPHSYTSEQTKAPTCTEKGELTYTCSLCGDVYKEEIPATGHSYGTSVTAPTCTEQGYTTYTCACGDSYRDDFVDAIGHHFGDDNICDSCGHVSNVEYMSIYFQNNWLWSDVSVYFWGSTGADNPGWPGVAMEYFANDGEYDIYVLKVPTDITGMLVNGTNNEGNADQSPDITEGWYDGICYYLFWDGENQILSEHIDIILPPVCQHPNTTIIPGKDATCTEPGLTSGSVCDVCGETLVQQEEIPAAGHSYVAGKCTACGDQLGYYLIGFINGADYVGDAYAFVDGKLALVFTEGSYVALKVGTDWYNTSAFVEGATSATFYPATESVNEKLYVPGNVEITFTLTVGEGDSLVLSYVTGACQHSYEAVVTEPTCTADGYTTHTCAYCDDSYTDSETQALGHNYVDGTCDRCGEAEPVITYITVYFQNNWLWTDVYAYVFVGETYETPWPGKPATFYANDGTYDVYCVTIPEGAGIIFSGARNDGSGTSDQTPDILGAKDGDCYWMIWSEGNAVEKDHIDNVVKPVCQHPNVTALPGKDATCTEPGLTSGSVCADCGEIVVKQTKIPALGHSYGDDEICDVCGETKPNEYMTIYFRNDWLWTDVKLYYWGSTIGENPGWPGIAMELHGNDGQYDIYKLTIPTDITSLLFTGTNTDGNGDQSPDIIDGWYDGICYYMFWDGGNQVKSDSIENILPYVCEHDYDSVIIEATCTADGSATYTCTLCGDTYTETLPATGHNYVNGVCHCGAATDGVTIHLVNTLGWSGTVAYAWENSTSTALNGWSWPGKIIPKDNDGYFTFHLDYEPGSGKALGLLFHNFNGAQTVDIVIDYATLSTSREIWIKPNTSANADGKFGCTVAGSESGLVVSPEVNGTEVTFRYAGSATSVFLAGSFNSWSTSATPLTKGEDGIWTVTLDLEAGVHEYKFVVNGSWIADPVNGVVGGYDGNSIVVVPADDEIVNDGKITVVLHFYRANGDYNGWDVWFWGGNAEGASAFTSDPTNKGMIATFTVDGNSTSSLGYVIRKSDWSDKEFGNRFIDLTDVSSGTVHYYVNSGSATGMRVLGEDTISCAKPVYATYNYEADTVWFKTSLPVANPVASAFTIVDGNGNATSIRVTGVTLTGNGYTLKLSNGLTLSQLNSYKVRYNGCDATISINTHDLFYSGKFASEYTYYGNDLGATWSYGSTTFKVWAPTAKAVSVKIYGSGNWGANDLEKNVTMTQGDKGVWYVTVSGNLHGKYYNYDVSFEGYTVEATDPYAKGAGVNGDRGMIVNMDATDPSGWDNDVSPNKGMSYTDAIIYETHIREFTIDASSGVDAAYRGKYLGLTQTGTSYMGHSTGLDYLKQLGITHIQLMPTYDFASIDEYHLKDWQQYAWGYDPKNFSIPEGSYATDPYNGLTRITEFKEMVQTFHENGINVVMDVVYNHTFDGGNYCGNKIVPNYYSRFFGEGNWSNGSGVGNDFATERSMVRNLIVDNVLYWVEEYHIDGFRFDLAGLIDVQTVNEIVSTVHAKYPYVMFYGEGWAAGSTAVQDGHDMATKGNAWKTGDFGYFNDDFRNVIAGNNGQSWGFASGGGYADAIANYFRASNSFSTSPTQTINYVSCHDNYCLTDKLLISRNGAYWSEIARMNSLSNALVLLSEGIPFLYSGDELLREKKDASGNRYDNAYGTNDDINKIRWSDLENKEYANMVSDYYAGLIAFRKNHAALRTTNGADAWNYVTYHKISDQTILFYISGYPNYECSDGIVVIFNASNSYVNVNLGNYGIPSGYWQACIHGTQAGVTPLWGVDVGNGYGTVGVEGISTTVLVLGDLVDENSVYNRQSSSCSHASHNISGMCIFCGKTVSHNFVGGTCSCGLSESAPSTYTVYFDNSEAGWENVNIYAWTQTAGKTKEYTDSWPGSAMTLIDEAMGIWAYELPIGAVNIVFNDGNGNQTADQSAPGYSSDKVLYSGSSWISYEACDHEYEDTVTIEVTCTMDGEVIHTCSLCGYHYTEVIEALGHHIIDEVTEPACTTGGCTIHSCSNCDYRLIDSETAKLGHSYGDGGICETCGAELKYYLFGYINGANYGSDGDEGTMGDYIFVDGQLVVTFASDSYVGVKTTDNEKWYMTDGFQADATSVTLFNTAKGINAEKLPVPGGIEITFTLVVNDDDTLTLSYTVDLTTCRHTFEDGVCTICGAIDPSVCEHAYESVITAPTCTEPGYTTHTCQLCGDSYADTETEALGHSYGEDGLCEACGKVNPDTCEHVYETVITAPTCTKPGYTTYTCTLCGNSYTGDETELAEHSYGEDGLCEACGAVNPDTCIHEYEDVVTNPTCTEPGFTTHTCQLCGNSYVDTETEPAGHDFGTDGICGNCGELQGCAHEYEYITVEPTCTEPGSVTGTCTLCGDVQTEETPALGHSYGEDGICTVCGGKDTENCEHEYIKTTVTASCTEPGGDKYTCSKCGDSYLENATDALGHTYDNGICATCGNLKPLSTTYYLVGWINGGNHGCEEDGANMGNYPITDNMFKYTFKETSYVFLKTEGNGKWFMCDGYPGDGVCFANLYDTGLPIQHDKVNVPGGVEITFTLIERDDGSVTLTYVTAGNCSHNWYTQTLEWPGCTTTGTMLHRCIMCADSYTTKIPAKGHNYSGANCTDCWAPNPNYNPGYYLVGWINGQNVGCEENWDKPGYSFSGGRLTVTFTDVSYVYLKTQDNAKWFMTDGYPGDDATSAKFYDTGSGIDQNKLRVPAGVPVTFYLTKNADGSLTLRYTKGACSHDYSSYISTAPGCTTTGIRTYNCSKCGDSYEEVLSAKGHNYIDGACGGCGDITADYVKNYYLYGWINGTNYGCEEDYANMGQFKFVDGMLTCSFQQDSYIAIKTSGNQGWYMAKAYVDTTTGTFYNTNNGGVEKMFVPGGMEIRFTLTVNANDTLTLTYTANACEHEYDEGVVTSNPTCTAEGVMTYTCSKCGNTKTDTMEMLSHTFEGDTCTGCGMVCQHTYELTVIDATCVAYADFRFTCSNCGNTVVRNAEDMADWMDEIPEPMPAELFEIGTLFRYRDYVTITSAEPVVEGYELVESYWVSTGVRNILYVAEWPAGFDTTSELYALYNGIKLEAFENEGEKLEITSDSVVGYLYYHWHNAEGEISDVQTEQFSQFCAVYSDIAPETLNAGEGNLTYELGGEHCATSGWFYVVAVYEQVTESASKEYVHGAWSGWTDWSEEEVFTSETREVETKTVYRLPDVKLGDHVYESVVTDPTCTESGYTTHTCPVCGDSYTDSETEPTGHTYGEDEICDICGAEKPNDYMTIYFQNNWLWTDVSLYFWGSTIAENPAWPGIAMELCGNDGTYDIYRLTIPTDITGLVINGKRDDGSDSLDQTPDILEGWYDGICYWMMWADGNRVGFDSIETILPSKPVVVPNITVGNPSVSFEGEIRYNFYFLVDDMTSVEEMGIALFREKVADGTVSTAYQVISSYCNDGGIYMVQTDGIAPKNMADAVYFKIYAKLTDGTYVYTDIRGYNTVVYANSILKKSENIQMKALVVALLNYGAEAQKFFHYNEENLMNAHLTAEQQMLVAAYDASMINPLLAVELSKVGSFARTDKGFTGRKPSVSFDGAFSINYYMTTEFVPEGDVKMYVWRLEDYLNADVLTAENASECMTMVCTGMENQYWGNVSDIVAKYVDQTVFVACVYTAGGVEYSTGVLAYSVGTYCQSNLTVTDSMNGLCAGAAVYSYYAKQYFASLEENA
jgi:pullulanase